MSSAMRMGLGYCSRCFFFWRLDYDLHLKLYGVAGLQLGFGVTQSSRLSNIQYCSFRTDMHWNIHGTLSICKQCCFVLLWTPQHQHIEMGPNLRIHFLKAEIEVLFVLTCQSTRTGKTSDLRTNTGCVCYTFSVCCPAASLPVLPALVLPVLHGCCG